MKVLFVTPWYPTPQNPVDGCFVREHARAVALHDEVVVLHAMSDRCPARRTRIEDVDDQGIRTVRVRSRLSSLPKTGYVFDTLGILAGLRYVLRSGFHPDVVHAHVYTVGGGAIVAARLLGVPALLTEHSSAFLLRTLGPLGVVKAKLAMGRAALVMPVSKALQRKIESYGVRARFKVVPNAIDTDLFHYADGRQTVRSDRPRLLTVCLFGPKKGIPYLLKALRLLTDQGRELALDLVGDGPTRPEYERLATDLGLLGKVSFHGLQSKSDVAKLMQRCDFLVVPSLVETFSVVTAEALSCGKPVVATRCGGPEELVDSRSGLLVSPGDAYALGQGIARMAEHIADYRPTAIAADARTRFGRESVGRQLHEVYASIRTGQCG